jgi:HD superfamily phosphohydrolase
MDADRMDYLLRDSYHAGVQYGRFDLDRVANTIMAIPGTRGCAPRLGFSEGGWHAAEGLVLARYFMFTQVYFHKTRVAFDIHLRGALAEILPRGRFPRPVGTELEEFLSWDDWKVLGSLSDGKGGENGRRLKDRDHYRLAYKSPEVSNPVDLVFLELLKQSLGEILKDVEEAAKNWYKTGPTDIPIVNDVDPTIVKPLSEHSSVVKNMKASNQVMLYVSPEHAEQAHQIVTKEVENERSRQGTLKFDPDAS